jgi:hypothetical protein
MKMTQICKLKSVSNQVQAFINDIRRYGGEGPLLKAQPSHYEHIRASGGGPKKKKKFKVVICN